MQLCAMRRLDWPARTIVFTLLGLAAIAALWRQLKRVEPVSARFSTARTLATHSR